MTDTQGKTRARDDEGKIMRASETPDKNEIICPLVLKVTNGQSAVNYDVTWVSTIDLGDGPGCWKSAPQQRGHADAFYAELKEMKEKGIIEWDEQAFYFTHAQGMAAAKKYMTNVISGKAKANKKSWNNRFEALTETWSDDFREMVDSMDYELPVTFDDLQQLYPTLYASASKKETVSDDDDTDQAEPKQMQPADLDLDSMNEPSMEEIADIEEKEDDDREAAEEELTSAVETAETPIKPLEELRSDEDDDSDDHSKDTVTVFADSSMEKVEISSESVVWKGANEEEHQAYLVEIPHMDREMWLELGEHEIGGKTILVKMEDSNPTDAAEEAGDN